MESLQDYGDAALIELHNQEKELTDVLRSELYQMQLEIEAIEREREMKEERELNEINKRLVKLKFENHILQMRVKHEEKTNETILSKNLSTIKREKSIFSDYSNEIEQNTRIQRETELDSINELVKKCQTMMNSNSLSDDVINDTITSLINYLQKHENSLNDDAKKIDQKVEQEAQENLELQKAIELVSAGININRRRTSIGFDSLFTPANINPSRRHSEIMPISLRKRQSTGKKTK